MLNVLTGAAAGRKIRLSNGQTATFGRTEWADHSFADDATMADVHFSITCGSNKNVLVNLGNETATLVDGKPVTDFEIHSGSEITAGKTQILITVDGEAAVERAASPKSAAAAAEIAPPPPRELTLVEICEYIQLDATATALAQDAKVKPLEFVSVLVEGKQFPAALRLMGHLLPPREAVWWAALCTRESVGSALTAKDLAALDAAEKWVKTGEETDRRKAHEAAEATQYDTAAAWVAMSAFWSEGSLAPIGMEKVPPDDRLTGQAVTGALLMAAVQVNPLNGPANYKRYFEIGHDVLDGKRPAPKK